MAVLIIAGVETKTVAGFDAMIMGIDPTEGQRALTGTVDTPAQGTVEVAWGLSGICCNNSHDLNLNLQALEVVDTIETAKKIGCM